MYQVFLVLQFKKHQGERPKGGERHWKTEPETTGLDAEW